MTTVELEGFSELEKMLEGLPDKLAKRATNRAMRMAAKLISDEIVANAPVYRGVLKGSIRTTLRNRNLTGLAEFHDVMSSGGTYQQAQMAMRGARRSGESAGTRVLVRVMVTAPHAHLVEFGTAPRFHKSGKYVGRMPANPFVRPAWDGQSMAALGTIKTTLTSEIARLAKES